MKPTLSRLAALTATCTTFCACNISKQRIDYSWFADTMMSAQDDEVMVEVGQGLNNEAAPTPDKPATPAPAIAATPAPLPPVTAPVAAPPAPAPAPAVAQNQPTRQTAPAPAVAQQQPAPSQQTAPAPESKSWFASLFGQKQAAEQTVATPKTYTVKAGDTLSVIARRHRVGMMALAKANNLANPNALRIGQVLVIPGTGTAPRPAARATAPATPAPTVTAPVTAAPAPVSSPAISTPTPAPAASATHTVSAGETLTSIARRYNTTIAKIMQANNMTPEQAHRLSIGQRILLPRP